MSGYQSENEQVPLGIVFVVIGVLILLTVAAVWVIDPATMPRPLYTAVTPYLPRRSAPTGVQVASVPEVAAAAVTEATPDDTAVAILPETPLQGSIPAGFVSAAEAVPAAPVAGRPMRIVIPQIGLDAPVGSVGLNRIESNGQTFFQWQVPNQFQAGWHNTSAPLGKKGNTVLNGHHNIFGEIFRDLIDLGEGDEIILHDTFQSFTYRITRKEILAEHGQPMEVRIQNAQWIEPTDDERITIVTCWPYTDNSHRLVVVAQPISNG